MLYIHFKTASYVTTYKKFIRRFCAEIGESYMQIETLFSGFVIKTNQFVGNPSKRFTETSIINHSFMYGCDTGKHGSSVKS